MPSRRDGRGVALLIKKRRHVLHPFGAALFNILERRMFELQSEVNCKIAGESF